MGVAQRLNGRPQIAEITNLDLVPYAGEKALEEGDARTALWHADSALREVSPPVETAQMLKVPSLGIVAC